MHLYIAGYPKESIFPYMTAAEALKKWLEWKGREWNQKRLARESGLSENTISFIKNEKTEPDTATIRKIAEALGITVAQFWQGPECMERAEPGRERVVGPDDSEFARIPYLNHPREPVEGEEVFLPHYRISASAGGGILATEPEIDEDLPFKIVWIRRRLKTSPGNLFLIDVRGDSMEPTLYDGDTVLVDRSKNTLRSDGIYVFREGDELFIKRIERQLGGKILIKSDNPRYEPYYFDPVDGEKTVFGKVVWFARTLE